MQYWRISSAEISSGDFVVLALAHAGVVSLFGAGADGQELEIIGEGF
jgi:hypothetical protein